MMESYLGTYQDDGAFEVYLASIKPVPIATKKNFLASDSDSGNYNIAFAHSGGTRTLVDKIESKKVTANYVVLAAPALLTQPELEGLSKYGVKKVIVYQSPYDILNELYVTLERDHQFTILGFHSTRAPALIISIDKLPLNILLNAKIPYYVTRSRYFDSLSSYSNQQILEAMHKDPKLCRMIVTGLSPFYTKSSMSLEMTDTSINGAVDINPYLKSDRLNNNVIPVSQSFWVGGSNRDQANLFESSFESSGIVVAENPIISSSEPPDDVHRGLGRLMALVYKNSLPPFDGKTIPGLKGLKQV